jgi:hypothetical protein
MIGRLLIGRRGGLRELREAAGDGEAAAVLRSI